MVLATSVLVTVVAGVDSCVVNSSLGGMKEKETRKTEMAQSLRPEADTLVQTASSLDTIPKLDTEHCR